ncbi:glutamate-rich protein 2 isoform X2 [Salmo trutta]|uniref:glutamate-rich protein 2 isoform X2 n=1 Tax=Salmo trutta TaxID=8032 RepID=UPI001130D7B4|nr:transcription initiation factor TFIID subunit 11-like isoform X2 [Salmo trutta]
MSRLECVGKSSKVPQKQVAPALLETHMPKALEAKYFTAAPQSSLPTQAVSNPMKVTPPGRFKVLCAGGVNNISVGFAGPPVILSQDLKMKDNKKPQQSASAVTGGRVFVQPRAQTTPCSVCVHPPAEPLPPLEPEGEEEHTEEEDDDDNDDDGGEADDDEEEGYRAPLELMAEFLKSVMEKDFVLAKKLCQMILVYEPNNPEAKQFIPLIQERLVREQEEKSQDDDDDCSDSSDEDDSGSDQDSPQSSDSSSSSSSDEEEELERRHKPCPPSHLSP